MSFSPRDCYTCTFITKIEQGIILSFPCCLKQPSSFSQSGSMTSASMSLFLVCLSFGMKSSKRLTSKHGLNFNGTLTLLFDKRLSALGIRTVRPKDFKFVRTRRRSYPSTLLGVMVSSANPLSNSQVLKTLGTNQRYILHPKQFPILPKHPLKYYSLYQAGSGCHGHMPTLHLLCCKAVPLLHDIIGRFSSQWMKHSVNFKQWCYSGLYWQVKQTHSYNTY